MDDEAAEDGMVEESPADGVEGLVENVVVIEEGERIVEGLHDVLDLAAGGIGPLLSLGALGGDALLLGLEHFPPL